MDFKSKQILGMIHLSGQNVLERAKKELDIFQEEGLHGAIIENYHGSITDVIGVLDNINWKDYPNLSLGINILPNDYKLALDLAGTHRFDFIQLDHIAGKYVNTEPIDEEDLLMVRQRNQEVKILGGVWPKYYQPINESNLDDDLQSAMYRCDAIVVTGKGTGMETPLDKVNEFRSKVGDFPLIVGAGLNKNNVQDQLKIADGAIVGSCFKPYNRTNDAVDRKLVQEFMEKVREL
jgi:predicted TIM-barrel enzyme